MTVTTRLRALGSAVGITIVLAACGPKDADIKADVDKTISGVQGVTVDVAKGVATITGQFADSATKTSTEAAVKGVKGVKEVVDNATVTPPPPPVVISPDDSLKTNLTTALKDYPSLNVDVKDGVVTLTGTIKRADLPKAMQAITALKPKKIDNKATVTK
jgi:osmotically-inducible protein OsmY